MDKALLDLLACPSCKGQLNYDKAHQQLTCESEKLAYPIEHGIPKVLVSHAQELKD